MQFPIILLIAQAVIMVLYGIFVRYNGGQPMQGQDDHLTRMYPCKFFWTNFSLCGKNLKFCRLRPFYIFVKKLVRPFCDIFIIYLLTEISLSTNFVELFLHGKFWNNMLNIYYRVPGHPCYDRGRFWIFNDFPEAIWLVIGWIQLSLHRLHHSMGSACNRVFSWFCKNSWWI